MASSRTGDYPLGYPPHPPSQPRSTSPSANNSPIDPSPSAAVRPPFGLTGGFSSSAMLGGNPRSGAGSPSHDLPSSSRLFSKRAREIQAQEGIAGLPMNLWGAPPTSGNSTPLRENIPESPTDGFPDFGNLLTPDSLSQPRRARAGTVPSRFPPGVPPPPHLGGLHAGLGPKPSSRQTTASHSPFGSSPSPGLDTPENTSTGSTLLSRLRAGSMPQRSQFANPLSASASSSSPFGPSIFGGGWNPAPSAGRERGSTLASIPSLPSNDPSSPSQSQFSREGGPESDVHMRTLDYLGLAETPQPARAHMATPYLPSIDPRHASRIRSYSVNNKDLHEDEYPDDSGYEPDNVSVSTHQDPESHYAALQDQLERTHAAIRHHNLAVQAFADHTTTTRRRAQTAGALDGQSVLDRLRSDGVRIDSSGRLIPLPYASSNLAAAPPKPSPIGSSAMQIHEEQAYDELPKAVAGMNLGRSSSRNAGLLGVEDALEGPTSALWLGNIPTSTTTSTLEEIFKSHGKIVSVRVLTHKNCGFVNFERVESAVSAKASLNGKEIFPGATAIRINFAKPASPGNTPGHDGTQPSPSPDPFAGGAQDAAAAHVHGTSEAVPGAAANGASATTTAAGKTLVPPAPELRDVTSDVLEIVAQFGATADDVASITRIIDRAVAYDAFVDDIPSVGEPSSSRIYDSPKLRELRKRIDNGNLSVAEIEEAALAMLPEIAELSSDYLGNTVVQKLFDQCSNPVRDAMLVEIAPSLAKIGCHKNGTWAAQKIIDVCRTDHQMSMIAQNLHPYALPLFLDQFGNYVIQCCLKFGLPYNAFIFETMMSRIGKLSHARFGARAMRACLESHYATPDQHKVLAAQIAIHGVHLATDQNGALLLTWYLDTCTLPNRRTVLAPRVLPFLVNLCTHKVAYLTVLKIINQKSEPEAREQVLDALFFTPNDQVLEAILRDSNYGATCIFKVLTTPFFDDKIRSKVVENIKNVLVRIRAQPNQGYKRLMDEVGLPTRSNNITPAARDGGPGSGQQAEHRPRPMPRHNGPMTGGGQQGPPPPQQPQQQHSPAGKQFYGGAPPSGMTQQQQQQQPTGYEVPDPNGMTAFPAYNQQSMMYGGAAAGPASAQQVAQQVAMQSMQYQQNMMGRAAPPMSYGYGPVHAGTSYGGYAAAAPVDQYRAMQPPPAQIQQMATPQSSFVQQQQPPQPQPQPQAPPGFNMGMGGTPYGYSAGMGGNVNYVQPGQGHNMRNSK